MDELDDFWAEVELIQRELDKEREDFLNDVAGQEHEDN